MSAPLQFPNFNPVIVSLGPFALRWYAVAYIAGLVIGWRMLRRLVTKTPAVGHMCKRGDGTEVSLVHLANGAEAVMQAFGYTLVRD